MGLMGQMGLMGLCELLLCGQCESIRQQLEISSRPPSGLGLTGLHQNETSELSTNTLVQ
jgi:hypothetical protein